MSTELFRLAAEITRPLGTPAPEPVNERTRALTKAREIIDQTPGASLKELVALAWLQGRIEVIEELFPKRSHDNSYCCQRCGRRVSVTASAPADNSDRVCNDCIGGVTP
jgi:hypothetical protein